MKRSSQLPRDCREDKKKCSRLHKEDFGLQLASRCLDKTRYQALYSPKVHVPATAANIARAMSSGRNFKSGRSALTELAKVWRTAHQAS
jgi:hypothetical protein